jgi:hypothetical protein
MLLVGGLYIAHALLVGRGGLNPLWLLVLLLPGALAARLSTRRGMQSAGEREGALAGLLTAHFGSALQVGVLLLAVAAVDWTAYGQEVGQQVAAGVRDAALPASAVVAALLVGITYAGCTAAGWFGALGYIAATGVLNRLRGRPGVALDKGAAPDWEG